MKLSDSINCWQFYLYLAGILVTIAIAWATLSAKVDTIDRLGSDIARQDHDVIIGLTVKVDQIKQDTTEIIDKLDKHLSREEVALHE